MLRSFPMTPRMSTQTGTQSDPGSTNLNDITLWTYAFTYGTDFHFEQDRVYGTVTYNISEDVTMALDSFVDAFGQLAQFIQSQSSIINLVTEYVPAVNAETTDQTAIDNASLALGAFLSMAAAIAKAAGASSLRMVQDQQSTTGSESYSFYEEEGTQTFHAGGDSITAWVATITSTEGPPTGMAADPVLKIDGYTSNQIAELTKKDEGIYAYYFTNDDDEPLQGAKAQSISARAVDLPKMQILERQDAISSVYLTRNEDIGGAINEPFVFTTPRVSFGNPLHPTITSSEPVDIALLGSPDTRSLDAHLTALFTTLFKNRYEGDVTIQLDVGYEYGLTSQLNQMLVPIPVAVLPPTDVKVGDKGTAPVGIDELIETISQAIIGWAGDFKPSTEIARLVFRLSIMSNLSVHPMPLLRLLDLELQVADIDPPLWST